MLKRKFENFNFNNNNNNNDYDLIYNNIKNCDFIKKKIIIYILILQYVMNLLIN